MQQKRQTKLKKILFVLVIVILLGGLGSYLWIQSITTKIFVQREIAGTASASSPTTVQQYFDTKTPFAIALLGYGGGNHDGPYLTDSIIVAHIDPKQKKVFLVSIPRDIWVKIPTNGSSGSYTKINQAYSIGLDDADYPNKQAQFKGSDGGGRLAEYILGNVTGLPIEYFVGLDFAGFVNTIDTLGGVDITVNPGFDDYAYPIEGKEDELCGVSHDALATMSAQIATGSAQESDFFPCRFEHLHFDAGQQHMDGTTALKYVRSRHSLQDGTDFGRSERQRNLIVAVKQKIFSIGFIPKVLPFITSLGDDMKTDLTLDDVKTLIQNSSELNKYQIVSLALTDQNYLNDVVSSDGQDVLESKDGIDNWTSVHNYLADEFSGKAQPVNAIVEVQNGTQTAGLASSATEKIQNLKIQTTTPATAENQNVTKTTITIYDPNVKQNQISALEKLFNVTRVQHSSTSQTDYNVLVVVGSDYKK